MASGAPAVQDPLGDANQPVPPQPPANPNPSSSGLTRLCPGCGMRRPIYHFYRRSTRSGRTDGNLVVNCASCRGFRPVTWVNTLPVVPWETDENRPDRQRGDQNDDDPHVHDVIVEDDGDSDGSDSSDSSYRPRRGDRRYLKGLVRRQLGNMTLGGGEVQLGAPQLGEPQSRDESEWILTGMGVLLYFFGWFSIVTLFVVIVAF